MRYLFQLQHCTGEVQASLKSRRFQAREKLLFHNDVDMFVFALLPFLISPALSPSSSIYFGVCCFTKNNPSTHQNHVRHGNA